MSSSFIWSDLRHAAQGLQIPGAATPIYIKYKQKKITTQLMAMWPKGIVFLVN